jgi:hypothetical protein
MGVIFVQGNAHKANRKRPQMLEKRKQKDRSLETQRRPGGAFPGFSFSPFISGLVLMESAIQQCQEMLS